MVVELQVQALRPVRHEAHLTEAHTDDLSQAKFNNLKREQIGYEQMTTYSELRDTVRADLSSNTRNPKTQLLLIFFRLCQFLRENKKTSRNISLPFEAFYRIFTESVYGLELRPQTKVGPGLVIFHGFGLVVNDHAIIGERVTLRNGVVIGNKVPNGPCPVVGNDVEIGANAIIIGEVRIGDKAIIGAGAVVTKDVQSGEIVCGNPAQPILRSKSK